MCNVLVASSPHFYSSFCLSYKHDIIITITITATTTTATIGDGATATTTGDAGAGARGVVGGVAGGAYWVHVAAALDLGDVVAMLWEHLDTEIVLVGHIHPMMMITVNIGHIRDHYRHHFAR